MILSNSSIIGINKYLVFQHINSEDYSIYLNVYPVRFANFISYLRVLPCFPENETTGK